MSEPIIQTHELTKHFHHPFFIWQTRARALTGLNLTVERGEIFGLLGPNGSGKSTTIKLLLGMLWPTAGELSVFSRRPQDMYVKQRIGFLPEETNLYRYLNAEETLDFYGRLFKLPRRERRRRVESLLDLTGLRHARNRPLGEFSKGMQRRIGLAQALINDPELVILDEPTSGLDPLGTREIKNLILELKAKKKTVLLSSHLLDDVEDVCDRVTILYGGKVRATGAVAELLRDEKRMTVSGDFSPALLDRLAAVVKEYHAEQGLEIAPARERLETLFLKVVQDAEKLHVETSGVKIQSGTLDFLTGADATTPTAVNDLSVGVDSALLSDLTAPTTEKLAAEKLPPVTAITAAPTPAEALSGLVAAPVSSAPTAATEAVTPTGAVNDLSAGVDVDLLTSLTKK